MNWTELLRAEMEDAYITTEKLFDLVDEETLGWKPSNENNWMAMGQLLMHLTNACGFCCRGFVTGDWGFPEGMQASDLKPEEMMSPAEKMPTVSSLTQAKELLAADKKLAREMLALCSEEELATKETGVFWDPKKRVLGHWFLQMIAHLNQHKAQLFYYLKLQGKPVNTGHLWNA